ncbi:hypothetical protein GGF46_000285 [Coemansia sp. RSA 552]|nr:hypothetical protein GGF46_000285 [Coemansia sp. RSA 552]
MQPARAVWPREANLDESQVVSDPNTAWRAFACMVPFTASDKTPLLMLYGGTSSATENDPLSVAAKGSNSLQVFDINNSRWYAPKTANAPKTGPVLPGCGAASDNIWVYDTQYGTQGSAATRVGLLDSVHWSWSSPTEQGQLPVTRFGAAFAYVPDNQGFYMHGGVPLTDNTNTADSTTGIANNLDILSPSNLKWSYASNGPARKYHTLCYMKSIDSIVLFGGSDANVESYNDVKVLSTKTNTWQYSPKVSGTAPAERLLHSAVCSDDTMYVFGGVHSMGDVPSDSAVWVLKANEANDFTWSKAPVTEQKNGPTARAGHVAALYDGNMYVYGGVGPSGQDGTIYRLDLDGWMWTQSSATGEDDSQGGGSNKTGVLIAAIVSSVLGVVVVGIAATIIYRIIRRRSGGGGAIGGRRHSDAHSTLSGDDGGEGVIDARSERKDSVAYNGAEKLPGSSETHDGGRGMAPARLQLPQFSPTSETSTAPTLPSDSPRTINGPDGGAALALPIDGSTAPPMIFPVPRDSPSSGGGKRMLDTVRAHARSLSTRVASSRLSAALSDAPLPMPSTPPPASRRRRTDATSSSAGGAKRRSTGTQQSSRMNMYGPDYLRVENEYRQAEAINEILLSGQPIPAWLRDAVAQADSESSSRQTPTAETPSDSSPGRKFTIANCDV